MKALGIKKLETNPEQLSLLLEQNEFLLITQQPLGMLIPFSSHLVGQGLVDWLAIKAFESGDLTLGQLAKALNKTKSEMLDTLDKLSISISEYDLAEDLETVETLMKLGSDSLGRKNFLSRKNGMDQKRIKSGDKLEALSKAEAFGLHATTCCGIK